MFSVVASTGQFGFIFDTFLAVYPDTVEAIISFASMISGLLTGSGVALLVLFRSNKKLSENILILSLVYFIGVGAGLIVELVDYIW